MCGATKRLMIHLAEQRICYLISNGRRKSISYGLYTDNFSFKFQSTPVVAPGSITFRGDLRTAKIRLLLRVLGLMQKRSANVTRMRSISRTGNELLENISRCPFYCKSRFVTVAADCKRTGLQILRPYFFINATSPTRRKTGHFWRDRALRSLDLARQVGAAIFSETGEIIALGANEVPKARGGNYWPDSGDDDRDYRRGYDFNDQRKRQILGELISSLKCSKSVDEALSQGNIRDSQFMDALEYGRVVHAEMSAICDAARMGRSTRGATLYCTTFPCHMCAKHVVASGLDHVVFLEPYPKSLASELHNDLILIEGADRGKYQDFPSVQFQHFFGITPLRYRELFERDNRKDSCNQFIKFGMGEAVPIIDIKVPFYTHLEAMVLKQASEILEKVSAEEEAADQANGK